jgi:hypothetical protein
VLNDGKAINIPCFSIVSRPDRKNSCNIPIPMGNDRGLNIGCGTPIINWDSVIYEQIIKYREQYPWHNKKNIAIFRGQLSQQTWKIGETSKTKAKSWEDTTRGFLYKKFFNHPLFDIGFTKSYVSDIALSNFINMKDQQQYKYILNVGNNIDWAERLRVSLFTNSLNIIHEALCQEWFQPLLKPYKHYIPTNSVFSDLEEKILWCINNDALCQEIAVDANNFANQYLTEKYMYYVFEHTLNKYLERFNLCLQ